jgi:hypothetical protein
VSRRGVLIAVDSVGIDPLGHDRADSVYAESRFLFPRPASGDPLAVDPGGALVETDVTQGLTSGAIECALTYTTLFSGVSAVERHGLMEGLGLKDALLEALIDERNLFSLYDDPCLANAMFPVDLPFFRSGYVEGLPVFDRAEVEELVSWQGAPVRLVGGKEARRGFAELFTLAEANQGIYVYAAQQGGVALRTYADVQAQRALTSSMTHELEAEFELGDLGIAPLPPRSPEEAGEVLASLASAHPFTFYKYQIPDLVSHTGRVDLARAVFATFERFLAAVLAKVDTDETCVVVTSDHGHLEQVGFTQGHPKSRVPTWYFGPNPLETADALRTPGAIYDLFAATSA